MTIIPGASNEDEKISEWFWLDAIAGGLVAAGFVVSGISILTFFAQIAGVAPW